MVQDSGLRTAAICLLRAHCSFFVADWIRMVVNIADQALLFFTGVGIFFVEISLGVMYRLLVQGLTAAIRAHPNSIKSPL